MISIQLPDGSRREFPGPVTVAEVAASIGAGLAKATVRRHRDNLWALGVELIRCRYDDDQLARLDIKDALRQLIAGDGGPLMCPRITESEQDSLDATCRKLDRFMRDSAAVHSSV